MVVKIDLNQALDELDAARGLDREELVANALLKVGVAYLERGRLDQAAEALDEARHYCAKLDNPTGAAQVDLRLAAIDQGRGDLAAAAGRLKGALATFAAAGEIPGQVTALERLAQLLALAERWEEAAACLERALELISGAGDKVAEVVLNQNLAPMLRRTGQTARSLAAYERMGLAAQELGDHQRLALALVGVGSLQAEAGSLGPALKNLAQAEAVYRELGQHTRANQVRGEILRLSGQPDQRT
ncbi:MAG: hypothetical protein LDL11_02675 [Desulfarculus sp.]|nr:hypothetical protein [Desulfarculus sp.]